MTPEKQDNWEKKFDELFELGKDPSPTRMCSPSWQEWLEIKSFIRKLLIEERQKGLSEGLNLRKEYN